MDWTPEDFLNLECVEPGIVFGQVECVCGKCNCSYGSKWKEDNEDGYECPNCGLMNEPV